ncbi:MAG: CoA-binding protein [Candidatus Andersenbacteria bacterium]
MAELPTPKAIVIVGASRDQAKYGNRAVRAYRDAGATVYPVNPNAPEVEGLKAFATGADVPAGATDLASIYTPPAVTATLLPELARYGIKRAYFNPGAETDELVAQARQLGIEPILACSVTAISKSPEDYAPAT